VGRITNPTPLPFPKRDEYGSAALFCNSSFLGLAIDFLMTYRSLVVPPVTKLSCCDGKAFAAA